MMLSRSACILIRVYAPQIAAAQPAATARHGRRRPPRRGAPVPRPALVRVSLVAGAGLGGDDRGDDHGGNLSQLRAPGALATFAGNLTGTVGTYLALLRVLLVSRIPFYGTGARAGRATALTPAASPVADQPPGGAGDGRSRERRRPIRSALIPDVQFGSGVRNVKSHRHGHAHHGYLRAIPAYRRTEVPAAQRAGHSRSALGGAGGPGRRHRRGQRRHLHSAACAQSLHAPPGRLHVR